MSIIVKPTFDVGPLSRIPPSRFQRRLRTRWIVGTWLAEWEYKPLGIQALKLACVPIFVFDRGGEQVSVHRNGTSCSCRCFRLPYGDNPLCEIYPAPLKGPDLFIAQTGMECQHSGEINTFGTAPFQSSFQKFSLFF